jgi:hypothetical protein
MAEPYDSNGPEGYGLDDDNPGEYGRGARSLLPSMLTVAVAVVAIGGFAGVLVYAYNKGKEVGSTAIPPIIKAGPAPHKIRPENPGGMKIANRDKGVYSNLTANSPPRKSVRKVERLLPRPENPVASPVPVASPAPVKKSVAAPASIKLPPPPPVAKIVPKLPPPKPRQVASAAKTTERASDARAQISNPSKIRPSKTRASTAGKWPSAKMLAAIAPAANGSTRIQLLSMRSEKSVRKAWAGFQKRHGNLLGKLTLNIERPDLGAKKGVYYRLQAGPLANVAAAQTLCSQLKKQKLGCIVVRR